MGWLFGYYDRKSLIEHLVTGNGLKTIKKCLVGNNLWCVHEHEGVRWACLYMLRGSPRSKDDPYNWGYKDVDESMGPYETSFPATWLDLLSPIESEYAIAWRERVKARGEKLKAVVPGSKWLFRGVYYTVVKRRSPTSWLVDSSRGTRFRMSAAMFAVAARCS